MAKVRASGSSGSENLMRPALTPEARESQMISLAETLAERQLRDGTASSQLITHYLKLATARERLERVKLERDIALAEAKAKALESTDRGNELYEKAIRAMRKYSGQGDPEDD